MWCTSSTASASSVAWRRWPWRAWSGSTCTWTMPRATGSSCRWNTWTASAATSARARCARPSPGFPASIGSTPRPGSRRPSRTSPGSCWPSTPPASRRRGMPLAPTRSGSTTWRRASPTSRRRTRCAAIEDVKADMERRRPMDRLICGDVGYGKTEVALRAAFKAVMDGKQVGDPGAHHHPGPAALQHLQRAPGRLSRARGDALPLPLRAGTAQGPGGPAGGHGGHRHRHPPPAAEGRRLQGPGPGDHRRGAALRRGPQGAAQAAAPARWMCSP